MFATARIVEPPSFADPSDRRRMHACLAAECRDLSCLVVFGVALVVQIRFS